MRIAPVSGEIVLDECAPAVSAVRLLLSAMIHQAMDDGMTALAFGVDPHTQEPWLKYFSPRDDNETSWSMTPPPNFVFPMMLQDIVSRARFQSTVPLRGEIAARVGSRRFTLSVALEETHWFRISWPVDMARKIDGPDAHS